MPTRIEWTDESWNPVTGCTPVSEGCRNCYARRMAQRLRGRFGYPADEPFRVTLHPDRLKAPLRWREPRRVFVCSMGDLFHEDVSISFICDVFEVIELTPEHTYQVLTKRPRHAENWASYPSGLHATPFPDNVWLGTSVEDQIAADQRIPWVLRTPAAVRFVSCEPMLGPIDLSSTLRKRCSGCGAFREEPCIHSASGEVFDLLPALDWVVCGCESGPRRRRAETDWFRDLRDQCQAAGVPFFLKQMEIDGEIVHMPELDGREWNDMPQWGGQ